jgi:predicted nucleic acid-binding protein
MKVIVDACSIILLAKSDVLGSFSEWKDISVSRGVSNEVSEGKKKVYYDALVFEKMVDEKRVKIVDVENKKLLREFKDRYGLGRGEAETIVLYLDKNYDGLITDNKQGRKIAKLFDIHPIGTPDIIVALCKSKQITKEKAMEALCIIRRFGWFVDSIIENAMFEVENE